MRGGSARGGTGGPDRLRAAAVCVGSVRWGDDAHVRYTRARRDTCLVRVGTAVHSTHVHSLSTQHTGHMWGRRGIEYEFTAVNDPGNSLYGFIVTYLSWL